MADHDDDFGPSTPSPAPSPEGDPGDPNLGGEHAPFVAGEQSTSPEAHEALFKHPHTAPDAADDQPRHPVFPLILGAAMVVCLVAAWIINAKPAESGETAAAATTPATPAAEPAAAEPAESVKALQGEVEGLKAELKVAHERIEGMPKLDLGPINSKIDELARSTGSLAGLTRKLASLDEHIGTLDKSLAAQRDDIDALKSEVKKVGEQAATAAKPDSTATATAAKPEDVNLADTSMEEGVDLFKAGKYKEASDVFKKLTETHPNDARVWYYAALSRGSATNQWTGETTRLVEKGVEREKAGSPESSKIDAVFTGLNAAFKPWLDTYRKSAKPR
jgi:tetratricopeptide (TPR) repeat protein